MPRKTYTEIRFVKTGHLLVYLFHILLDVTIASHRDCKVILRQVVCHNNGTNVAYLLQGNRNFYKETIGNYFIPFPGGKKLQTRGLLRGCM
jgi:hypothetical protein